VIEGLQDARRLFNIKAKQKGMGLDVIALFNQIMDEAVAERDVHDSDAMESAQDQQTPPTDARSESLQATVLSSEPEIVMVAASDTHADETATNPQTPFSSELKLPYPLLDCICSPSTKWSVVNWHVVNWLEVDMFALEFARGLGGDNTAAANARKALETLFGERYTRPPL
jgi:hypothetical protein